ncbi:MAG: hypothetical protein BRC35_02565 [Cyanobacteria bacterium QH_10_48_56]|nr:MAG: hypothetical protein BRC35_02565 [Cyanobacteria bacterium QH_10_48_56]
MPLDYSHQDLQGSDFKGRDLAGTNFSHTDVRGTNFTGATLKDANFTNAKAGLQNRWVRGLVIASLFLSLLSGAFAGFTGFFVEVLFLPKVVRNITIIPGLIVLISLAILFVVIIRQGLGAGGVAGAGAGGVAAAGAGGAIAAGAGEETWAAIAAVTVAGAIAVAVVGVVAMAVAGAVAGAAAGEEAEAGAGAVAVAGAVVGLGIYVTWRALAGDEKYAFVRRVALFFAAIGGTSFQGAYLTNADFTQATLRCTNFLEARLTRTRFGQAEKLNLARVGKTILNNSSVRNLLTTVEGKNKSFVGLNFEGANLEGAALNGADFTDATLTEATLEGAKLEQIGQQRTQLVRTNLQGANLSKANLAYANCREAVISEADFQEASLEWANLTLSQVVSTDFTSAHMTGACVEAWNIESSTKLEGVDCDFVYLLENPNPETGDRERRPSSGEFATGEFTKLFQEVLHTVDFIFRNSVDWTAFFTAFKKLQVENKGTELAIQSVENKGDDVVVVKVDVSPDANKEKIHSEFTQNYELALKSIQEKYQAHLEKYQADLETKKQQLALHQEHLNDYRQRYTKMEEIVSTLAAKPVSPVNVEKYMIDQSSNFEMGPMSNSNMGPGAINFGEISGTVADTINQLPDPSQSDEPGVKELLTQLKTAIEDDTNLSGDDKAQALARVQVLAEAGNNPSENQQQAKGAIRFFRGLVQELPNATNFVEACSKLIPAIARLFGLS